jgi:hypothetical protein
MKLAYGVFGVVLAGMLLGTLGAADRTSWQIRADIAVRKYFDDDLADKVRAIFSLGGKGTKVKEMSIEPDGEGVIAKIKIAWSGSVIAIDYGMTIRWRFTKDAHVSSGVDSLVGIGIVTDKNKTELDDFLRTKVFPLVQADAAKPVKTE